MSWLKREWTSLKIAISGFFQSFSENHVRMHIIFGVLATAAGFYFEISYTEWMIQSICIGAVISAEIFNTAIEELCDVLHPDQHPKIKKVKDFAAGGVFASSIGAIVAGILIYAPKICALTI